MGSQQVLISRDNKKAKESEEQIMKRKNLGKKIMAAIMAAALAGDGSISSRVRRNADGA